VATFERLKIVMIGSDEMLKYLVDRYAQHGGYEVITLQSALPYQQICDLHPLAVLFPSIQGLERSQTLVAELVNCEIPIIVCSSVADTARARELGADQCLAHPLTYEDFSLAMAATETRGATGGRV